MDLFLYYRNNAQYEAGRGHDGKPLVKDVPVEYVGTSGGASTSDSDSGTPTSDIVPLKNVVTTNTTSSGGATALDSSSPTSNASPRGSVSTNPSSSSGRSFAPGHLVALPDIKEFARGRVFDRKTSTYLWRRCCGVEQQDQRGTIDGASTKLCQFLIWAKELSGWLIPSLAFFDPEESFMFCFVLFWAKELSAPHTTWLSLGPAEKILHILVLSEGHFSAVHIFGGVFTNGACLQRLAASEIAFVMMLLRSRAS
jgi:hypothetical protein